MRALEPLTLRLLAPASALQRLNDNGTVVNLPNAPDGLRELPYGTNSAAYCADRPVLRRRARLRSAVAQRAPRLQPDDRLAAGQHVRAGRPVDLTADGKAPKGLFFPSARDHGQLEARERAGGARHAAHDRPAGRGRHHDRAHRARAVHERAGQRACRTARRYTITVRACNDGGRCSATLGPVSETADQGESPLTQPSILQEIEIAVRGRAVLEHAGAVRPLVRAGHAGLRGPDAEVRSRSCIDEPSVGRLRLASTRGGNIDLRWRPSRAAGARCATSPCSSWAGAACWRRCASTRTAIA